MPEPRMPTPTAAAPVPGHTPAAEDAAPAAAPSEAVAALLTKLSVALNRRRAYGASHPMMRQAEADALAAVRTLTREAGTCTIGVAQQELLVDGVPIAASHAVARDLAQRLHRRGVGALAFDARITDAALSAGLAWLAAERRPGGARTHDTPPAGEGFRIGRVAYDRLVLGDESPEDEARELAHVWRALAAAAFEVELTQQEQEAPRGGGDAGATGGAGPASAGPGDADRAGRAAASGATAGGNGGTDGASGPATAATTGDHPPAPNEERLNADELAALDTRTPEEIARAIDRRAKHEPYARHVAYVLLTLANQIQQAPPPLRASLGERLRAVLSQLERASVSRIIGAIGTGRDQRRFLASVVSALPVSAVIDWLELSAHATDQQLSHQLLRLLAKLSRLAGANGADSEAAQSFHSAVHGTVAGWELDDPTPVAHTALLDRIASAGAGATGGGAAVLRVPGAAAAPGTAGTPRAVPASAADASAPPVDTAPVSDRSGAAPDAPATRTVPPELAEHARLVQMACEIDAAGEDAIAATEALVAGGEAETLLAWLDAARGTAAAAALREAAVTPGALRAVLLREPFEQAEARALLGTVPVAAGPVLFDILGDAEHRTARRMVYDALRRFGPAIMPEVERRLAGSPPWFVTRNLLALVRDVAQDGRAARAGAPLPALTLLPFLDHARPQVRVEALRCLAEDSAAADAAIRRALDDADPAVVAVAIDAAAAVAGDRATAPAASGGRAARLSRALATRLMELVDTGTLEPERAGRAVRALAAAPSPAVRDWLLGHVTRKRLLLGLTLVDATPSVCAALRILAARYGNEGEVPHAVELALAATDARRDAAEAGTREALGSRTPPRGGPASERAA